MGNSQYRRQHYITYHGYKYSLPSVAGFIRQSGDYYLFPPPEISGGQGSERVNQKKSALTRVQKPTPWPWPWTIWPHNKWVSRTHGETFLCHVWWSQLHRFLRYHADKQTDRQTPVETLPLRLPSAWVITSHFSGSNEQSVRCVSLR